MIYGRGGPASSAHPRKNPRAAGRAGDLKFDKRSRGSDFILFSELEGPQNENVPGDELASRFYNRHPGLPQTSAVTLEDVIRHARNECSRCGELIAGSLPRHIQIVTRLESVGAEVTGAHVETICDICHNNDAPATPPVPEPPKLQTHDGWKALLKARQKEAWERVEERRERQADAAKAMAISQPAISQLLGAARKMRDRWRVASQI